MDEIVNDITGATPASFEPTIDYVVTKIPRWAFEKLPGSNDRLGTRMQSVGEVMGIGRTFPESLQKAVRSLEQGRSGLNADPVEVELDAVPTEELALSVAQATPERLFQLEALLRRGVTVERLAELTGIDPWFISEIAAVTDARMALDLQVTLGVTVDDLDRRAWRRLKQLGFSDQQLAYLFGEPVTAADIRAARTGRGVGVTYKTVDTCGAEFEAHTPVPLLDHRGRGRDPALRPRPGGHPGIRPQPDRPGHRVRLLLRPRLLRPPGGRVRDGHDQLQSGDRLHRLRHVGPPLLRTADPRGPGQRARRRTRGLGRGRADWSGSSSAWAARPRSNWQPASLRSWSSAPRRPRSTWPRTASAGMPSALAWVSPSLRAARPPRPPRPWPWPLPSATRSWSDPPMCSGGRAMEIVYDDDRLVEAVEAMSGVGGSLGREGGVTRERPVLVDRFLEDAVEVDVDAVRDGTGEVVICGVMEHVEEAGVHSGDSACALPPQTLAPSVVAELERMVRTIAEALQVRGLINVQFAVKDDRAYVLEANPRASRTVPFVAKATGVPVAMVAARVMVGATLAELRAEGLLAEPVTGHVSVKEAVLPFNRFPGVDTLLGPEMRSTGEVMGIDATFGLAFAKSQIAAGNRLPVDGTVFLSLADRDKSAGLDVARQFAALGFALAATSGTAAMLEAEGIPVGTVVAKVGDSHPGVVDAVDLIAGGKVQLVVNTPRGRGPRADGLHIRSTALAHLVPVSDHGGRGPCRRGRHRRLGQPSAVGPVPAGVPPAMSRVGPGREP